VNWRRLNNVVHRDLGYLAVGLTIVYEMNQLHLNTPKGVWTIVADIYAVGLIVMAITGMFVLKGKTGITGRGAWLTAAGVLLPTLYWAVYLALQ
jgi:hypothetical protein